MHMHAETSAFFRSHTFSHIRFNSMAQAIPQSLAFRNLTNSPPTSTLNIDPKVGHGRHRKNNATSADSSDHISPLSSGLMSLPDPIYDAERVRSENCINNDNIHCASSQSIEYVHGSSIQPSDVRQKKFPDYTDFARDVNRTRPSGCNTRSGLQCQEFDKCYQDEGNGYVEALAASRKTLDDKNTKYQLREASDKKTAQIRSFSLNDLDCLSNDAEKEENFRRTSLSREVFRNVLMGPSYPLSPTHPPPEKSPTPPRLPSFGTTEAQELRLTPSSRPEWFEALLQRLQRLATGEWEDNTLNQQNSSSAEVAPQQRGGLVSGDSRDALKRILGIPRMVTAPSSSAYPQRARLPAGIRVASVPGALIRAEDGSMVRGRFGVRVSGHGVGARPIDAHPLNYRSRTSEYNQAVREIDKAVERAEASAAALDAASPALPPAAELYSPPGNFNVPSGIARCSGANADDLLANRMSGPQPPALSRLAPTRYEGFEPPNLTRRPVRSRTRNQPTPADAIQSPRPDACQGIVAGIDSMLYRQEEGQAAWQDRNKKSTGANFWEDWLCSSCCSSWLRGTVNENHRWQNSQV